MKNIGGTLKKLREENGMTRKEAADRLKNLGIDISDKTLYGYESGRNSANADMFLALCEIYKCNNVMGTFSDTVEDILFTNNEWNMVEKYRSLDDPGRAHVDTVLDWEVKRSAQLRQIQNENESLKLRLSQEQTFNRLLSYYGRIAAAGKSYGFEDMICGTIQVPLTDENQYADYAIGVNGNSMEPDFTGEDIVYVQKASHLNKGEIGIFQKDNCIYIKKVGDGVLLSINPDYGPIPGGDVKVLGRVLGKIEGEYKVIK